MVQIATPSGAENYPEPVRVTEVLMFERVKRYTRLYKNSFNTYCLEFILENVILDEVGEKPMMKSGDIGMLVQFCHITIGQMAEFDTYGGDIVIRKVKK